MNRAQGKKPTSKNKEEVGEDKKNRVRSFLESLFRASTHDHIEVDIGSLKKFFEPNQMASKALQLTLEFKELTSRIMPELDETNWEGWACCYCQRYFPDPEEHFEHILDDHLKHHDLEALVKFSSEFAPSFPPEWAKKILDSCWKPIDVGSAKLATEGASDWDVLLVSADTEREKLLVSISVLFRILLQRGVLHVSHLDAMLDYAMANLPSAEVLKMNGVDRSSLLCFRCLDAPPLEHIRDFLKNLFKACKLEPNIAKEKNSTEDDDKILDPPDHNMRVVLDGSRSCVLIYADKWLVPSDNSNGNVSHNLDAAAVISWLYDGPPLTIEDNAKSWFLSMSAGNRRCHKIFKELQAKHKELCVLHRLDDHWMRYKRALQNVVLVQSFEEERKAKSTQLMTIQSPIDFLEGWKEQLPEDESKDFRSAFTKILKEAEDTKASESRDDNFITNALAKEKKELNIEFHQNAARVRKNIYDSQQLMSRVETISSFDFRIMVIAFVKCFLRAKWEREAARVQDKRKRKL